MITLNPIGFAYNERHEIEDDYGERSLLKLYWIVLYQRNP